MKKVFRHRVWWLGGLGLAALVLWLAIWLFLPGADEGPSAPRRTLLSGLFPEPKPFLDPAVATVVEENSEGVFPLPGSEEMEAGLHAEQGSAGGDIEILQELLSLYSTANGGQVPLAPTNQALVQQLYGANEKRVAVLSNRNKNLNARGELLDRWGTPYFFHPVSSKLIEIRSAGPDRVMWTEDDIQLP